MEHKTTYLKFFFLLLLCIAAGCSSGGDWVVNPANDHAYQAIDCGLWEECDEQATSEQAHLVTVNDQAEQDWLIETFGEKELYWIGLNDAATEGTFEWSSGEAVDYTNWGGGEPNDSWTCGEDYVMMGWRSPGKWNDMGACSPEWNTINQAIVEKAELEETSYWWLIAILLVAGLGGLVLALLFLRRRGQAPSA